MAMRKNCAAEIKKFCKEVKPGHGRIAVCLNEHPSELSPRCKEPVGQMLQHMNAPMEMHKACAADAQKFCGDVPPGKGHLAICLGEHTAELSPDCKAHVAEMKAGWGKRGPGAATGAKPAVAAPVPPPAAAPAPPPAAAPVPPPAAPTARPPVPPPARPVVTPPARPSAAPPAAPSSAPPAPPPAAPVVKPPSPKK
jgi:hypothetical protein